MLGAGNCNDIDLIRLTNHFSSVTLVDVDVQAVVTGVAKQGCHGHPAITIMPPVDASGVLEGSGSWSRQELAAVVERASAPTQFLPQRLDVLASTGVLSQILSAGMSRVEDPEVSVLSGLFESLTLGHLATLDRATAVGGRAVLTIEFVSSVTLPELLIDSLDLDVEQMASNALGSGNYFAGLHPSSIAGSISRHVQLGESRFRKSTFERPWVWRMSSNRGYIVYAVTIDAQ